jgi:hypothetical protein
VRVFADEPHRSACVSNVTELPWPIPVRAIPLMVGSHHHWILPIGNAPILDMEGLRPSTPGMAKGGRLTGAAPVAV